MSDINELENRDSLNMLNEQITSLAKSLKPIHLKMAVSLAEGKTQDEAYIEAGGKGKDPRSAASNLIKTNQNISSYISMAKAIACLTSLEQLIGTVDQKRRMLWATAQACAKTRTSQGGCEIVVSASGVVRAISELNKMDGDYAAIKTQSSHSTVNDLIDELIDQCNGD